MNFIRDLIGGWIMLAGLTVMCVGFVVLSPTGKKEYSKKLLSIRHQGDSH